MAQISRLRAAEISNGNLINADDLDAEFDQLVNESNSQDTRITAVESSTITTQKTFNAGLKTDTIDEKTAAAGVTVDSVLLKDGMVTVSGTPASNGQIGYDSNIFKGYANGAVVNLQTPYLKTIRVYTSSGTWTKPSGLAFVRVRVIGGGGGGGGRRNPSTSVTEAAGGGGGGGYAEELIQASSLGATESYVVGAGGTAGADTGGDGGTGGTSSFGTSPFLQATGGAGGKGTSDVFNDYVAAGGDGGVGSNGDINTNGQPGGDGISLNNSRWAAGNGGGTVLSGGTLGAKQNTQSDVAGTNGTYYGTGGTGAIDNDTTGSAGGTGAAGVVIVEEWCYA